MTAKKVTKKEVLAALGEVMEPELHKDLVTLGMIRDVKVEKVEEGYKASFTVVLTTPACPMKAKIRESARAAVAEIEGVCDVEVKMDAKVPSGKQKEDKLPGVRNYIAVASGKGGVGKSTISTNVAIALAQMGAKVGLLDADIYGPNIPLMMGINRPPTGRPGHIEPLHSYGVDLMSIGFLVPPDKPVIWRGPMIHGAITQFIEEVEWGELDYLVIDLPPGTGDAAISLVQLLEVTGAVLVTTPQEVALADVVKGAGMFSQMNVPIFGVVENMSYFVCPHCGERTEIFSHGGGKEIAKRAGVPFLGEVPIDPVVRAGGDAGKPVVVEEPDSPPAKAIVEIAKKVAAAVSVYNIGGGGGTDR
jgi:ATP-binding protein involved in chromosome partitioning